MHYLPYQGE
ncbi:hypothetical protein D043_2068A, partial [Vibrio parahaemolyticus EKP-021]